MQVVEKSSEGLSRVLEVTIPVADLTGKLGAKAAEVAPKMNIKGFRPGKVPVNHVLKMYGKDLMSEIVQEALNTSSSKAVEDKGYRPASQPELNPTCDFEAVLAGTSDLSFEVSLEIMPEFTPVDPASLELNRPVYAVSDADVDEALTELASQSKSYEKKGGKAPKAADKDQLVIDFEGSIDGELFEGGSATDSNLVIGSGQFIPGFEDQLVGAKVGEERVVKVTFPENYGAKHLAGKDAEFKVTVKEIKAEAETTIDDDFATRLGLESLEKLKEILKSNLEQQYSGASRFKAKRALLDVLDEKHAFDLPPRMVEAEFAGIWQQIEADKAAGNLSEDDAAKSENDLKAEYKAIAERRVRLGLVLAEIGRIQNVVVSDQEVLQAIAREARNYPGQEKQVFDFYRQNPAAAAQIRAPMYEEKVVDAIFGLAKVTETSITKEDLLAEEDA